MKYVCKRMYFTFIQAKKGFFGLGKPAKWEISEQRDKNLGTILPFINYL